MTSERSDIKLSHSSTHATKQRPRLFQHSSARNSVQTGHLQLSGMHQLTIEPWDTSLPSSTSSMEQSPGLPDPIIERWSLRDREKPSYTMIATPKIATSSTRLKFWMEMTMPKLMQSKKNKGRSFENAWPGDGFEFGELVVRPGPLVSRKRRSPKAKRSPFRALQLRCSLAEQSDDDLRRAQPGQDLPVGQTTAVFDEVDQLLGQIMAPSRFPTPECFAVENLTHASSMRESSSSVRYAEDHESDGCPSDPHSSHDSSWSDRSSSGSASPSPQQSSPAMSNRYSAPTSSVCVLDSDAVVLRTSGRGGGPRG